MEVNDSKLVGGKGLYSLKYLAKGDIVFVLSGSVKDTKRKLI